MSWPLLEAMLGTFTVIRPETETRCYKGLGWSLSERRDLQMNCLCHGFIEEVIHECILCISPIG